MSQTKTTSDRIVRRASGEIPRDPAAARPTEHFLRRYSRAHGRASETRSDPPITGAVIRQCITDGVVSHGRDGAICYEADVGRHTWRLVVGFDPDPVVITAYVPGVHGTEKYGGGDRD